LGLSVVLDIHIYQHSNGQKPGRARYFLAPHRSVLRQDVA
jgi:hypothetical protein